MNQTGTVLEKSIRVDGSVAWSLLEHSSPSCLLRLSTPGGHSSPALLWRYDCNSPTSASRTAPTCATSLRAVRAGVAGGGIAESGGSCPPAPWTYRFSASWTCWPLSSIFWLLVPLEDVSHTLPFHRTNGKKTSLMLGRFVAARLLDKEIATLFPPLVSHFALSPAVYAHEGIFPPFQCILAGFWC